MSRFRLTLVCMCCAILAWCGLAEGAVELPTSRLDLQFAMTGPDAASLLASQTLSIAPTASVNPPGYEKKREISRTKAIALTLLLPGAGHLYMGEKGRAEFFLGTEAVAWLGAAAFYTYGNWKEDDYRNYAVAHAGISSAQDDNEFYKMLSFYDNVYEYNGSGRLYESGRPYYNPNDPMTYWYWDSPDSRAEYRTIRNAAESSFRNAVFMIGVAAANRIIAGIDAFRILKRKTGGQKKDDEEEINDDYLGLISKFKVSGSPFGDNPRVNLSFSHQF
ncbi:MAG: hypothetical protein JW763_06075 [candidate division Zixibacteria bacterium]|nr:hypothetical protein [candidate division Zixibacteria bacterium]